MRKLKTFWILALIALLPAVGWVRGGQKLSKSTWEYKIVEFHPSAGSSKLDIERMLNQQGGDGWEMIQTEKDPSGPTSPQWSLYYFKRVR